MIVYFVDFERENLRVQSSNNYHGPALILNCIGIDKMVTDSTSNSKIPLTLVQSINSEPVCQFSCELCNKHPNPLTYCSDRNGCVECQGKRNALKCFIKLEAKRDFIAKLNENKQQRVPMTCISQSLLPSTPKNSTISPILTVPTIHQKLSDVILHDHYYWITLKSSSEDGSGTYIVSQLIRNYNKMMPRCTNPKANSYSIQYKSDSSNQLQSPTLYGLIRYNGLPTPYKMSASSNIFSHVMRQETTHLQQNREKKMTKAALLLSNLEYSEAILAIKRLTIYTRKKYETNRHKVLSKWQKINSLGNIVGDWKLLSNYIHHTMYMINWVRLCPKGAQFLPVDGLSPFTKIYF